MHAWEKKPRRAAALLAAWLLLLSACAPAQSAPSAPIEPRGRASFAFFDTVTYIYSYAGDTDEELRAAASEVFALLGEYHELFDIYERYEGVNNLAVINDSAGKAPVPADEKLIDFLLWAKELYEFTGGKMNVMLGSVLRIWHRYREDALERGEVAVPTAEELSAAAEHTAIESLVIDREAGTVFITDPEASIDVGAVGKGYATEMAARLLADTGRQGYALNVGGNIRTIGTKPGGDGWVTAIRDPNGGERDFALSVLLRDAACVTSGFYERFYVADGVRYHHVIDPDTLFPAAYFASVTVICPDSGLADALSTALYCTSWEEGLALAERAGADAIWIGADGQIRTTDNIKDMIVET